MLYRSETWAVTSNQTARLDRTDMRMVRWMCGVALRDQHTSAELRERMEIEPVIDVLRKRRLRWLGMYYGKMMWIG